MSSVTIDGVDVLGLPPPAVPHSFSIVLNYLLNDVLIITLIVCAFSISVAKTFALRVWRDGAIHVLLY